MKYEGTCTTCPLAPGPKSCPKGRGPSNFDVSIVSRHDMHRVCLRTRCAPSSLSIVDLLDLFMKYVPQLRCPFDLWCCLSYYIRGRSGGHVCFPATNGRCGWNCDLRYRGTPALHAQGRLWCGNSSGRVGQFRTAFMNYSMTAVRRTQQLQFTRVEATISLSDYRQ